MLITAEGIIKSTDEEHLLRAFVIEALLLDIGFVVSELIEGHILIQMIVDIDSAGDYGIRLGSKPRLLVHITADIA